MNKDEVVKMLGNYKGSNNLVSSSSGREVANQEVIKFENGTIFNSYGTFIGAMIGNKLYLTEKHCCSATTSKYVGEWCGLSKSERLKGIQNGTIVMVDC